MFLHSKLLCRSLSTCFENWHLTSGIPLIMMQILHDANDCVYKEMTEREAGGFPASTKFKIHEEVKR